MAHSFLQHNGQDVFFINHRGLSGEELLGSFRSASKYVLDNKKEMLIVVDLSDTTMTKELDEYVKGEEMKATAKYIKKQAVVGITGIKKMVLRIYNALTGTNTVMCDTVEEALDKITK